MMIMTYCVILCRKCRWAWGAEEGTKTSRCPRCLGTVRVKGNVMVNGLSSPPEVREAVARVNGRLMKAPMEVPTFDTDPKRPTTPPMPSKKLKAFMEALAREAPVTRKRAIAIGEEINCGPEVTSNMVKALMDRCLLYEPRPGLLALVE